MSRQINLALVGCGGMGRGHVEAIKKIPDAKLVALCDIDPKKIEQVWTQNLASRADVKRYTSLDDLLANPPADLDGVLIVTPHTLHYPQAMATLDAGYPVLVEKPMVTRSSHAKKLADKVKSTGLLLQVAFQASYSAEFSYIRQVLREGGIGELQTVTAWSHQGWKEFIGNTWRADPKFSGGGQMYDTGAHLFNAISWAIDRPVEEVFCTLDNKGLKVDVNAVMTIRWQGGVMGSVTISGNNPGWDAGIIIAGNRGRLHTSIHGGTLEHYQGANKLKYPPVNVPHYTPVGNFVDCLLGKAEPLCPVRYGILHSWLMDALYESAKKKMPVRLSKPPLPIESTKAKPKQSPLQRLVAAENAVNPC